MAVTPLMIEESKRQVIERINIILSEFMSHPKEGGFKIVNIWVNNKGNLVIEFEE